MSSDDKTVIQSFNNETKILDVRHQIKIVKFSAPGADKAHGETYRSSGIVIVIVIEYTNVRFQVNDISYQYLPQVIDGDEYKIAENILNQDE
ncbi:124_t:CDS:2 [Acaulospora colombiana]|uniref:124_t:CDS:1 n=1 Tax=Acaulospora colombiana TaxID=27376 RepID=A0ACA9MRN4_9GLOM|nr:124_t:CDS:2 [Acaulospora colombiana]